MRARNLLARVGRALSLTGYTPLFSSGPACRCVLLYKFPKGRIAEVDLGAGFCADYQFVQAMEILDVRECRQCLKRGGSPWFYALWEGGEAVIKDKLMALAAESVWDPDVLYLDRNHPGVDDINCQDITGANLQKAGWRRGTESLGPGNDDNLATAHPHHKAGPIPTPGQEQPGNGGPSAHHTGNQHNRVHIHGDPSLPGQPQSSPAGGAFTSTTSRARAITIHLTPEEITQLRDYNRAVDHEHLEGYTPACNAIQRWALPKLADAIRRRDDTCANPEAMP